MRAATHGCNEGSIEAGWLGQSHLPVMLNYVPTTTSSSHRALAAPRGSAASLRQSTSLASFPPAPSQRAACEPTEHGGSEGRRFICFFANQELLPVQKQVQRERPMPRAKASTARCCRGYMPPPKPRSPFSALFRSSCASLRTRPPSAPSGPSAACSQRRNLKIWRRNWASS